jgi:hypothetical protein
MSLLNLATIYDVHEYASYAEILTTEIYLVRKEAAAEVAARLIRIRVTGRNDEGAPDKVLCSGLERLISPTLFQSEFADVRE